MSQNNVNQMDRLIKIMLDEISLNFDDLSYDSVKDLSQSVLNLEQAKTHEMKMDSPF